jgi:hypothetical protein
MAALHNASGTLTPYGFACGYREAREYGAIPYRVTIAAVPFDTVAPRVAVTLARDGGAYFVALYDYTTGEGTREGFARLTAARKHFNRECARARRIAKGEPCI